MGCAIASSDTKGRRLLSVSVYIVVSDRRPSAPQRRFLMVTLHTFGPLMVERLIRHWEGPAPARPRLSTVLNLLYQLNITAFYLGSAYYHLDKRATGIRYVSIPELGRDKVGYEHLVSAS